MRRNLLLTPFLLIVGLFSTHTLLGQTIVGPSPVGLNSTYVYSISPGTIVIAPTWTVSKGTIVQNNGSSITVTWTATGTGNVRLFDVDGPVATKSMSIVSCSAVTVPSISSAYTCTGTTATLNATVGSGGTSIRWYDSSTNPQILASTASNAPYTTYALAGSTTFYAATVTSAGCESAKVSITVQLPSLPTAANVARCGTGTVTLNATAGANGTTTRWYAGASGGTVLASATSYTTPSLSANATYYASSYNATTQCESLTRKAVNVAIDNAGTIAPASAPAFSNYTGNFTLSGQTGTILRWEKNVDNAGWVTIANTTTSNNYSVANVSNTQLRAVVNNAGCGNPSYSTTASVNVYAVPQILVNGATPTPPVYNNYGYGVSLSIPAMGYYTAYQWYKNGTAINGATASSYSVGLPGSYTVRVWSGSASVESAALTVYEPNIEGDSVNAVSRTEFIKAGTNAVSPYTLQPNDLLQTVQYSDGLGRAVQTIGVGQSLPSGGVAGDLVVPTVYGRDGLADTTFLPYTTTQVQGKFRAKAVRGSTAYNSYTTSEQYLYYQGTAKVASDNNPFARVVYRNTPDARVVEQGAPGAAWQPGTQHTVRNQMNLATSATFPTLQWKANGTTTGYYPDNTIWVTTQTDENNHALNVYTDKKGKTILKQQQTAAGTYLLTYYVYDDNGQLIYQLPPKAMAVLGSGTTLDANNPAIAELIYQYKYDSAGQVIEQKVPGSGKKSIVYDKGRVVLTQDANQKAQGVWAFIKYDFRGRPIYSGRTPVRPIALRCKSCLQIINMTPNCGMKHGR
ncbi:MAG: hypothetical protein HOP30_18980 [Cyclobacteriaceae bacterium]|nr:hypothetical protein [Cyclobacteriaceae bacterium]